MLPVIEIQFAKLPVVKFTKRHCTETSQAPIESIREGLVSIINPSTGVGWFWFPRCVLRVQPPPQDIRPMISCVVPHLRFGQVK